MNRFNIQFLPPDLDEWMPGWLSDSKEASDSHSDNHP